MPLEMPTLLASALVVGLLGSLHCVGMCGPLAVAVACGGARQSGVRLALWIVGKAATYLGLGVVAGLVGAAFGASGVGTRPFAIVGVGAGVLMVIFGGSALWRIAVPRRQGKPGPLSVLLSATLRGPSAARPWTALVAGLLTGLLPCGLVYAMTAQAVAVGSPLWGGVLMAVFGLGTAPSLLATGLVSRLLSGRVRRAGEILAASAVILMGVMVTYRGVAMLLMDSGSPPCCH